MFVSIVQQPKKELNKLLIWQQSMGVVNEHLKYFSFVAGTLLMSVSILTVNENSPALV